MHYNLKTPCHECPYVGKVPGWIGAHDTAQDFVDLVRVDAPFPCHESIDYAAVEHGESRKPEQQLKSAHVAHCAGYAIFMSKMSKLSRRPELAAMQDRLKAKCKVQVVWPPDKLVELHDTASGKAP